MLHKQEENLNNSEYDPFFGCSNLRGGGAQGPDFRALFAYI